MDKILRVDMSNLTSSIETAPAEWAGLHGRSLTSTIVATEVDPLCHPLGKKNKLIFAPGSLTGTIGVNTGRLSAGAKSPLTGGIKESNAGGTAGQSLARLGIQALIIEGLPAEDKFYNLHIDKNGVVISAEEELLGQGNFAVVEALNRKFGDKVAVLTIGQAGEQRMAAANISVKDVDSKLRSHGRGGLGAVMGAKKIKYISIDASETPAIVAADPEQFKTAGKYFAKAVKSHHGTGEDLPMFGTAMMINIINEAGALPTRNYSAGRFEDKDGVSGETMRETILKRGGSPTHGCQPGCIVKCSQVYVDDKGEYVTSGFEYETIWGFGPNLGCSNLDVIARADNVLDDIGLDSIEMGGTFGVAMEAGVLPFGDGEGVLRVLLEEVAKGTPLGRIIGSGAVNLGKVYGMSRVPAVKGQSMPAYDPRGIKGLGVTYATSPMGADHTAGFTTFDNLFGPVTAQQKEGQVDLSRHLQIQQILIDSAGLCHFIAGPLDEDPACMAAVVDMINARYGTATTVKETEEHGKRLLKVERAFNIAAGISPQADRLPELFEEPLPPLNPTWDLDEELKEFWNF